MSQDRLSLDQIRRQDKFDFKSLYGMSDNEHLTTPSFYNTQVDCDYYTPEQFRSIANRNTNSRSYLHLNCRSLSANWESFKELLCELQGDKFSFDLIGISEIFKCERDHRLKLPGFHDIIFRCRDDDNREGVRLFIKDNICYKIRNDLSIFIPHVIETLFIEITENSKQGPNTVIGIIYRPNTPPRADIDIFCASLLDVIDIISNEKKRCMLMGDCNIDLLKYNTHDKTTEYVDNLLSRGIMPLIHYPTRVTHSTATLLDHMYTNNISLNSKSGIIVTDVADHFGTFHVVPRKSISYSNVPTEKRIYSDKNINCFKKYLEETNFRHLLAIDCPDVAYNSFIILYNLAFEKAFPLIKTKAHRKYVKVEPWMTAGLIASLRTKSKLFQKKLSKPMDKNISLYKNFVSLYNKVKRKMKIKYFENLIELGKHNMKMTWKTLKQAIGKQKDKSNFPNAFLINDQRITDKQEIAESFNNDFSNIGKRTSQNVPSSSKHFSSYLKIESPTVCF